MYYNYIYNICIIYNMPAKMNMFISNGNFNPQFQKQINTANLASSNGAPAVATKSAPSSLTASIISRIHNVTTGCGSCGRH